MFDATETAAQTGPFPIHRLGRHDAVRLTGFVAALDSHARHLRFDRLMTPAMLQAHYEALDWSRTVVLAWGIGPAIRGIAEAHLYTTPKGLEAEIALCVAQGWRGRGIGQLLAARALAAAAGRGAWRSVMLLPPRDQAHARLARSLGATIDPHGALAVVVH